MHLLQAEPGSLPAHRVVKARSSGVGQRFMKAGRGVGEQTGLAWCHGNALRQWPWCPDGRRNGTLL